MKKYLYLFIVSCIFGNVNAQFFTSASQGYFSVEGNVKVIMEDSSSATFKVDPEFQSSNDIPEYFYLIDDGGNQVEIDPEEIISIEILRGEEKERGVEVIEFDESDYETIEVTTNTESKSKLVYERVSIDYKNGTPLKSKKKESMLLQLASVDMGDFLKVYISPNFEAGGTEVAPLGETVDILARNREDYNEVEKFYFIKIGEKPAVRISHEQYNEYAPMIYEISRGFRREFSIPKGMAKDRTKKRKKTSRDKVGKKKKKASPLRYDEMTTHLGKFQEYYVVEEAERQAKIKARQEARETAKAARSKKN